MRGCAGRVVCEGVWEGIGVPDSLPLVDVAGSVSGGVSCLAFWFPCNIITLDVADCPGATPPIIVEPEGGEQGFIVGGDRRVRWAAGLVSRVSVSGCWLGVG